MCTGGTCGCPAPITTGAITLTNQYVPMTVIANGGYAYSYDDGTSTACVDSTALCGTGVTGTTNRSGTVYGAAIGVNLNQAMGATSTGPFAVTGSGIAYALDNLPSQGMRIIIDQGGADYCATLTTVAATVPWSRFNTKCWDNTGIALIIAPTTATHINFEVTAVKTAEMYAFCVMSVSFAP
jgi:hypothetical protein